ncbi:MAG: SDR family NAD(P)-dependent oxidoreductase [Bacteroidota bacterium]
MIVVITGVSRGLGFALANEYLNSGFLVYGIGRSSSIKHKNFSFIKCDLSSWEEVENLEMNFPLSTEVLLINNAGIIEPIKRISDQDVDSSKEIFQINTIAPIQLIRKFSRFCENKTKLTIVNISSGAARRAIPSWANYCASKAALDLFSETFQLEEIEKGYKTKIFSLAPGVIDTEMQKNIRNTKPADFSSYDNFVNLKNDEKLLSSEFVASKIKEALEKNLFSEVCCRLE